MTDETPAAPADERTTESQVSPAFSEMLEAHRLVGADRSRLLPMLSLQTLNNLAFAFGAVAGDSVTWEQLDGYAALAISRYIDLVAAGGGVESAGLRVRDQVAPVQDFQRPPVSTVYRRAGNTGYHGAAFHLGSRSR